MKKRKGTYTPAPSVPSDLEPRYETVLEVLRGETTLVEAAKRLRISRVQMQTLVHRAKEALVEGLSPKPPGKAPKSARELELEQRVAKLERENTQMRSRNQTAERLMDVMGDILKGHVQPRGRSPRKSPPTDETTTKEPEEPDGVAVAGGRMLEIGLTRTAVSKVLGVSATTLRRHLVRRNQAADGRLPREPDPALSARAAELVRTTRGLIGAEALSHATGLSRRRAAAVKEHTRTLMERERVAACDRVTITQPGVLRGFDQLWVQTTSGRGLVLVCADGAIPYRTSLAVADRYDSCSVAETLDADFATHGAPLVCRLDRASCHMTDEVDEVLAQYGVLRLHGPARYPQYYAQLERQNREHQAWLEAVPRAARERLPEACIAMRYALNDAWPRRSLGWMTAAEKWATRVEPCDDELDELLVTRLAIERTLVERGYLRREPGGWC